MRSLISLRAFAYNPRRVLPFEDGKYNILENKNMYPAVTSTSTILFGATFYLGTRLFRFHSEMSWLSFLFQGSLFAISGVMSKLYYNTNNLLVSSINLLENGEEIEIQTIGVLGRKNTRMVKIEEIKNPEDDNSIKMHMNLIQGLILKTTDQLFLIAPNSNMIDNELLQAILKGENIEVNNTQKAIKDEDIIDI